MRKLFRPPSRPLLARPAALAPVVATLLAAWHLTPAHAAIDAVRGKTYKLSSQHGPWMIMVTSFSGDSTEQEDGEKIANDVVFQLRKKGVPAYIYRLDDEYEEVNGYDRMGRATKRKYLSQHGRIGVVAGNYSGAEDRVAQLTLKFVKNFTPKVKVDGIDGQPADLPISLSKAFLARNPLLSPEELAKKTRDPLLLKLNSRGDYSLMQNKGKYTLVVATFSGNSHINPREFGDFASKQQKGENISLENAAERSELLCRTMRAQKKIDAYVWHERFRSIVTVGAFQSPNDPEIARLTEMFRAKYKPVDDKGTRTALIAESFQIPGKRPGDRPIEAWAMDPEPILMPVPR
ncbi:MAG: hypothetical protein ACT4QC_10435 [Planctomycetaceae bacterium]